jgi:hypothetical protein
MRFFIDDEFFGEVNLNNTINGNDGKNPFREYDHYILLDLALGTNTAGTIDDDSLPIEFQVDYIRLYQKK